MSGQHRKLALDTLTWLVLLAATLLGIVWFRLLHSADAAALYGFEPSGLVHPVWGLPQFANDFPNGEAQLLTSLAGRLLEFAGWLGIPTHIAVGIMVLAEAGTLAAGAAWCARASDASMPNWRIIATALMLVAGTIISCDLGRWFHPYYGATYNFANGLGLAAIAAMLKRRAVTAGLLIGLSSLFHPTIPLFFGVGMATIGLLRLSEFGWARLLAGAGVAGVIFVAWAMFLLPAGGAIGQEGVDSSAYIMLTRLMSSHWFPISLGVFTSRSWETFLPFLAVMLLLAIYAGEPRRAESDRYRELAVAAGVLAVIGLLSTIPAEYSGSPLVTKLALHRASAIALLIAAMVVVPKLLRDALSAPLPLAFMAGALLLWPFWRDHGLPIFAAVAFALLVTLAEMRAVSRTTTLLRLAAILVVIGIPSFLMASERLSSTNLPHFFGHFELEFRYMWVPVLLICVARLARSPLLAAVPFVWGVWVWAPTVDAFANPALLSQAQAYREVQDWARENTPPDSLFMTDPGNSYGWRQFSERPSFGTMREWLYSAWLYDTRSELMAEGLRRAGALGFRPEQVGKGGDQVADASASFHAATPDWLADFARRFGIRYFVFDKTKLTSDLAALAQFENDRYLVVAAPVQ